MTIGSAVGALPIYARENEFFLRAGLTVEVLPSGNGPASLGVVAGGAVEIGQANAGSIAAM